ncbi:MAG: ABC transporter permease [Bacillota bacterium]|jgi:ABC-2 type transport system permease protein
MTASGIAFGNILRKDLNNYYLKPPNISWGIIFPIAWALMFFLRSKDAVDVRNLLPGVMAMAVLFGTTSLLSVTLTFERKSRSFERLLLAPLDLNLVMLAKTTGAIAFGIVNALVPVVIAAFVADLAGINWFIVWGGVILIAITSTFLGLFISVTAHEVFEAQTYSNFFRFPMLFLCGLFVPITQLPTVLRPLSYLMPLTYGTDILKTAIHGDGVLPPELSFPVLIGFSVALFLLSMANIKKKWIY